MKQLIKKQNSKFTPYWNYSVEGLVQDARKQQQDYLDKPAQWHIDEIVELNKRLKSKVNNDTPIDIERITKNINEYIETAKTILQYSVEEYYYTYLRHTCDFKLLFEQRTESVRFVSLHNLVFGKGQKVSALNKKRRVQKTRLFCLL
jgi:hypothetical protein